MFQPVHIACFFLLLPGAMGLWPVFSARRITDLTVPQNMGLSFDQVIINDGNYLNPDTGVFVCPESGVYVFHAHIAGHPNKAIKFDLYRNRNYILSIIQWTSLSGNSLFDDANSAILELEELDIVFIKCTGNPDCTAASRFTSFTGYRI